jgi:hypothetical protein
MDVCAGPDICDLRHDHFRISFAQGFGFRFVMTGRIATLRRGIKFF